MTLIARTEWSAGLGMYRSNSSVMYKSSWVQSSALCKPVMAVNVCHLGTGNVAIRPGVQLHRKLPEEFEASPKQTGPWLRKKVKEGGG